MQFSFWHQDVRLAKNMYSRQIVIVNYAGGKAH